MPDLPPTERLQPCLLDRLTDNEPGKKTESRDNRVLSLQQYRRAVLRDLSWLLNTMRGKDEELISSSAIADSVLNYGIRDLTGLNAEALSIHQLEREILAAIKRFEPRIMPDTLRVRGEDRSSSEGTGHLYFEITGTLWARPMPEELDIQTEVDLGTGRIEVRTQSHG